LNEFLLLGIKKGWGLQMQQFCLTWRFPLDLNKGLDCQEGYRPKNKIF
jgi:hypothetical protein